MATILQKATEILDQKNRKIIPENLRKGVKVFGVEGTLDPAEVVAGVDTFDADAIPSDIIKNRTAYVNNEKITGTMEDNGELILTPGDEEVEIPEGYTSGGKVEAVDITNLSDYDTCLQIAKAIWNEEISE